MSCWYFCVFFHGLATIWRVEIVKFHLISTFDEDGDDNNGNNNSNSDNNNSPSSVAVRYIWSIFRFVQRAMILNHLA
jgi:hypothetical protein